MNDRIIQFALSLTEAATLELLQPSTSGSTPLGNCVPLFVTLPADILTPVTAYLRITDGARSSESFLLESVVRGETAGRWSYVGSSKSTLSAIS
jgi:anthranilate synthase component 1